MRAEANLAAPGGSSCRCSDAGVARAADGWRCVRCGSLLAPAAGAGCAMAGTSRAGRRQREVAVDIFANLWQAPRRSDVNYMRRGVVEWQHGCYPVSHAIAVSACKH